MENVVSREKMSRELLFVTSIGPYIGPLIHLPTKFFCQLSSVELLEDNRYKESPLGMLGVIIGRDR